MIEELREIMTRKEVAAFLKVGIRTVERLTKKGHLKGYQLGERGLWRYFRKDVMEFLKTQPPEEN